MGGTHLAKKRLPGGGGNERVRSEKIRRLRVNSKTGRDTTDSGSKERGGELRGTGKAGFHQEGDVQRYFRKKRGKRKMKSYWAQGNLSCNKRRKKKMRVLGVSNKQLWVMKGYSLQPRHFNTSQ